jgi:hypothetical protein
MPTWHQKTPEERTFHRLVAEEWESLSEAAQTMYDRAEGVVCKAIPLGHHGVQYNPEEYEADMKVVRRAAAELTEEDCETLTKIWRSALVAAAAIDPHDLETLVGYRVYTADLHRAFRMLSSIVEDAEREKRIEELRKAELAEREPIDREEVPF